MADATGFMCGVERVPQDGNVTKFGLDKPDGWVPEAMMGDEIQLKEGESLQLIAESPAPCLFRLLKNGEVVYGPDTPATAMFHGLDGPGVYRLEAWVVLDGEKRPWIYANPIYVR